MQKKLNKQKTHFPELPGASIVKPLHNGSHSKVILQHCVTGPRKYLMHLGQIYQKQECSYLPEPGPRLLLHVCYPEQAVSYLPSGQKTYLLCNSKITFFVLSQFGGIILKGVEAH